MIYYDVDILILQSFLFYFINKKYFNYFFETVMFHSRSRNKFKNTFMTNNLIYEKAIVLGDQLKSCALNDQIIANYAESLKEVNTFFNTSNEESALLCAALCCEDRDVFVDVSNLMEYLMCNRLDYFMIVQLLESLDKKGLISVVRVGFRRKSERINKFEIATKVYEALYHNTNENLYRDKIKKSFFEAIDDFMDHLKDDGVEQNKLQEQLQTLLKKYNQDEEAKLILSYKLDTYETIVLFALIMESICTGINNKICLESTLSYYIGRVIQRSQLRRKINTETSNLNTLKLIEIEPRNYKDSLQIGLSAEAFDILIPIDYKISYSRDFKPTMSKLIKPDELSLKTLHYNDTEQTCVNELQAILENERLLTIQSRLQEKGLRKGVQILFYGPPGTGKTETVYQLAKSTNRKVLMVEINKIKSMWVGESEKNLKKIFDEYALACKQYDQTPILLFNESDALINKRISIGTSVDSMQNAMQNILLQELENFDGIFIATTNLLGNLDEAFNRRFLYKLQLNKPEITIRQRIIGDLIPYLSANQIAELANTYDLSGGQLENIYRKSELHFILSGNYPNIDELKKLFDQENFNTSGLRNVIKGFAID